MRFSLLDTLDRIPIAVVDVETTGASAALGDRIIEIGIVRIEAGRVVGEYQQLINPHSRRISPGVTALTGITPEMVAGKPGFSEQLVPMRALLEGAAILGHNIPFDLSFLRCELRRAGLDIERMLGPVPVLDTVRIARRRFGRGGNSLPVLSRRLGVDPVTSHRALADAQTTAAVFDRLVEPVGGWSLTLCDALEQQGGPLPLASPTATLLPLELEEALELSRPVIMEYVDAGQNLTRRTIQPLHVRRQNGELILIAHCHLRQARRTFKLDRIVRLMRGEPAGASEPASAPSVTMQPKPDGPAPAGPAPEG